jgi:hypothetical protein
MGQKKDGGISETGVCKRFTLAADTVLYYAKSRGR